MEAQKVSTDSDSNHSDRVSAVDGKSEVRDHEDGKVTSFRESRLTSIIDQLRCQNRMRGSNHRDSTLTPSNDLNTLMDECNGEYTPNLPPQSIINIGSEQMGTPNVSPIPEMPTEGIPGPSSSLDNEPERNTDNHVTSEEATERALEDDILQILGDEPKEETALESDVDKDIASRWQDILKNGLAKETKDKIFSQYLVPANCKYLLAPLLNPEAKAAVSETIFKRETTILQKQSQLGIALAALSKLMESVLSNETSKQKLLQPLSDACRLICDSHYMETNTRRNIILSSINVNLKDTLANTTRDKFLFGEDVSEKLKMAKSVQKTGESLQKVTPKLPKNNTHIRNSRGHLNYKGQHRKTPNRLENDRSYRQRVTQTPTLRAPLPRTQHSKQYSLPPPPPLPRPQRR